MPSLPSFTLSFVSLASVAALGCTPTNSNTVPTSQLQAQIQVNADDSGNATVQAELFSHPSGAPPLNEDSIDLVPGDSLTATSNGSALAMNESFTPIADEYMYSAAFAAAAADQSFSVTLDRTQGESAGPSTVTLPAPFAVTPPTSVSRSQAITVTWSPSGSSDAVSISFAGCGDANLGPVPDTGTATFAANALTSPTSSCAGTLAITRSRNGTLATAYGQGGAITANQVRTLSITTTP